MDTPTVKTPYFYGAQTHSTERCPLSPHTHVIVRFCALAPAPHVVDVFALVVDAMCQHVEGACSSREQSHPDSSTRRVL